MLPETYDPSFLIDLVSIIRQRESLGGSLSESVKKSSWMVKKEAGTKVLASQLFLDCRARRSGWVGSTTLISSAFIALLNCAEVGRRNRILTN